MHSGNYVENVLRTDSPITAELIARISEPESIRLLHAAMGLATESGEFIDMLKKHIFYGRPLDFVNAKEELGDAMWYVGLAIDVIRTTLDEVMTTNIKKLRLRYPEKFSEEKAHERNLEAERELLEGGYEGVSDKEYCAMNNLVPNYTPFSKRGTNWCTFAEEMLGHIEQYTVPQYGDKGEDQVTEWNDEDCVKAMKKYLGRYGKNQRAGQQKLDLMKIAHYAQLTLEKLEEQ